jgi:hypothetical protein
LEEQNVRGIQSLSGCYWGSEQVDKFDGDLFRKLVEKVRVVSMVEVEFVFKVGIAGREVLG